MEEVILTSANFTEEVEKSNIPVIIDFWATWCGPCKMLAPELEQFAKENNGVKVCKVNVDDELPLAEKFQIEVIPTLVLIKNGKEENRFSGYVKKEEIAKKLGL